MKIKKIEKYETSDGAIHDNLLDAEAHQKFIDKHSETADENLDLINNYRKSHRQKFVPVKYFEEHTKFTKIDFSYYDYDNMEEFLLFEGSNVRDLYHTGLEISSDSKEISRLLKERILTFGGYETNIRLNEYKYFCEILSIYSSEMSKEDVINIFHSIELIS